MDEYVLEIPVGKVLNALQIATIKAEPEWQRSGTGKTQIAMKQLENGNIFVVPNGSVNIFQRTLREYLRRHMPDVNVDTINVVSAQTHKYEAMRGDIADDAGYVVEWDAYNSGQVKIT